MNLGRRDVYLTEGFLMSFMREEENESRYETYKRIPFILPSQLEVFRLCEPCKL